MSSKRKTGRVKAEQRKSASTKEPKKAHLHQNAIEKVLNLKTLRESDENHQKDGNIDVNFEDIFSFSSPSQKIVICTDKPEVKPEQITEKECITNGCFKLAIKSDGIQWEDEYCSYECVVAHCADIFDNWAVENFRKNQEI